MLLAWGSNPSSNAVVLLLQVVERLGGKVAAEGEGFSHFVVLQVRVQLVVLLVEC